MKINGRGGHTEKSIGARDVLDELTEDRKIFARVKQLLIEVGNSFNDCTPPENMAYPAELNYGVNKCNSNKADVFFSTHLNSEPKKIAYGAEVLVYPGTQVTIDMGNRILNNLANLGFENRGIKQRTDLMELYATNCPAMIIETCFVHAKDAAIYRKVGVEKVARAIANGIDNRVGLNNTSPTEPPSNSNFNCYTVKITADVLNVRKGPGTNYGVATAVKRGEVYTIVSESNGWGRLKSGAGWISLEYTSKASNTAQPKPSETLKVGSRVKITGSKYATGQNIPSWVKSNVYTVQQISGSKALIKEIVSWVYIKDLILV